MDKLVYIADTESSVFESQVVGLLNALSEKGLDVTLLQGSRTSSGDRLGALNDAIQIVRFRMFPSEVVFLPLQVFALRRALRQVKSLDDSVIHVRSEKYGMYLKLLQIFQCRTFRLLVDVRGAVEEESMEFKEFNPFRKWMKKLHFSAVRRTLKGAEFRFSAVSRELADYVQKKFALRRDKITVTPCTAVSQFGFDKDRRRRVRQALGIGEGETVILFSSSGNAKWQAVDRLGDFAAQNPGFQLINLSRHSIELPNVLNMFVPLDEVPGYLDAADFGLILRDASVVNHVACPVKFVEYAVSGLPVLCDGNVQVIAEHVKNSDSGLVLDNDGALDTSALAKLSCAQRRVLSDQALSRYNVHSVANSYCEQYKAMRAGAVSPASNATN